MGGLSMLAAMSYYRYHVFFCTNLREDGTASCEQHGAKALRDYMKQRIKDLQMAGPGGVRVNTAGCMDRCALGPVMAVYPEAVWYTYVDQDDIDEIIDRHLRGGETVERLKLPDNQ